MINTIKNYLFLALCAVSFGSIAYGMSNLEKPTQEEVRQVHNYLADALEKARAGNFKGDTTDFLANSNLFSSIGNGLRIISEYKRNPDANYFQINLYGKKNALLHIGEIGFCIKENNVGHIDLLAVEKPWRNNGIAPYFLRLATIKLIQKGCASIELCAVPYEVGRECVSADRDVNTDPVFRQAQQGLISFYKRFGFKETKKDGIGYLAIGHLSLNVKDSLPHDQPMQFA